MRKIIFVVWFTERSNTIGIVVTENEMNENRAYIGKAKGIDPVYDMEDIAYWGARFPITAAAMLMDSGKGEKKNHILKTNRTIEEQ